MRLTGDPFYFSYKYAPPAGTGKTVPVSTVHPTDKWVTVGWGEHLTRPDDPDEPDPTIGGWTFLYGGSAGAVFQATAEVLLDRETPGAQAHICLWEADADGDEVAMRRNAWEWEVGRQEGHWVHLDGAWNGQLAPGRKLRLAVDYWHAPVDRPARIVQANITGMYWRLPA